MNTNTTDPKTNRDRAYEAICELHEAWRHVKRATCTHWSPKRGNLINHFLETYP